MECSANAPVETVLLFTNIQIVKVILNNLLLHARRLGEHNNELWKL